MGYQTQQCKGTTWYLLGAQFENVTGGALKIDEFIKSPDFVATTSGTDDSVQIQVWDYTLGGGKGGYQTYYYLSKGRYDGKMYNNIWATAASAYDPNVEIRAGQAVWFKCPNACTITVAGQVAQTGKKVTVHAKVWNFFANPYPMDFLINGGKVDWVGILGAGKATSGDDATVPQIQTWDLTLASGKGGYNTYWYLSKGRYDGKMYNNVWTTAASAYDPNVKVDVGCGFWYMDPNAEENYEIEFAQ